MSLKISIGIIFLLTFNFCAPAQQREFEFKNLTQENGLPSNESYFVYRDSKDFLWIATDQGVVRYNGSKMERFNLPDNVIFKIREDNKGRIWFFSHTGKLAYFFKGAIHPYQYNDRIIKAFKSIVISNAYITDDDEIIMNSAFENIKISRGGAISKVNYITEKNINKGDSTILSISPIKDKQYFVRLQNYYSASDSVYIKLTGKGRSILYKVPFSPGIYPQSGCVTANEEDFFLFYGNTIIKLYADGSSKVKYFPSVIASMEMDKDIWLGFMKNGTVLLDTALQVIYKDLSLKDKTVTSIRTDHEGGTWFSTLEKGVFYLKNSGISHVTGDSSLSKPVFRLFAAGDKGLLFANSDGVYRLAGNNILPVVNHLHKKVTDLFIDQNKNVMVAASMNASTCGFGEYCKSIDKNYKDVFFINSVSEAISLAKDEYLFSQYSGIYAFNWTPGFRGTKKPVCLDLAAFDLTLSSPGFLFMDSKKQIWKGAINSLYKFNTVKSSPVEFKHNDTLFKNGFTCMRQLDNGIYTIGIRFGGVVLMQDTTVIARITENEGLLSNSIKYLLPAKNKLWVATAKGISVINFQSYHPVKYTIANIGKNDGFNDLIIYQLMLYQAKMLVATSNGIYEIDQLEKMLQRVHKKIPFYINTIKLLQRRYQWDKYNNTALQK